MITMPSCGQIASEAQSRAGHALQIRERAVTDVAALMVFLRSLSPETARRRYLSTWYPNAAAVQAEVARLTECDASRLVLVARLTEADQQIVAIAELVQERHDGAWAEAAVVVADAYQGLGIGRAVVNALARAVALIDIRSVYATVTAENRPIRQLITSLGYAYTARFDGPLLTYELHIPQRPDPPRPAPQWSGVDQLGAR